MENSPDERPPVGAERADFALAPEEHRFEDDESASDNESSTSDDAGGPESCSRESANGSDKGGNGAETKKCIEVGKSRDAVHVESTYKDYSQVPLELSNEILAAKKHLPAKEVSTSDTIGCSHFW